jgi:hypothetical protein
LAYDPEDGKSYEVLADEISPDFLELRASLRGLPWLGETYRLHSSDPIRCQ